MVSAWRRGLAATATPDPIVLPTAAVFTAPSSGGASARRVGYVSRSGRGFEACRGTAQPWPGSYRAPLSLGMKNEIGPGAGDSEGRCGPPQPSGAPVAAR